MAHLDGASLTRLRSFMEAAQAQWSSVIRPDVLQLSAALRLPGRVVIDLSALELLGQPLVVFEPQPQVWRAPALTGLSPRESDVAALVARGLANKEIARRLGISVGTVKHHIHRILEKTDLPSRAAIAAAVAAAIA